MLGDTEPFKGTDKGVCMPCVFPGVEYRDQYSAPTVPMVTFLGLLVAYPNAGIQFLVRNFNLIEPPMGPLEKGDPSRMSVCLGAYLPEDQDGEGKLKTQFTVWVDRVNLSRVLHPDAMDLLRNLSGEHGRASVGDFLSAGQQLSDLLRREVMIVHQYGGNMEYATYDMYKPFVPGGDGKIERLP